MKKLKLHHPGGRGSTTFEIGAEGHEVWMRFPMRSEYGVTMQLCRFMPSEALQVAEALSVGADAARTLAPEQE